MAAYSCNKSGRAATAFPRFRAGVEQASTHSPWLELNLRKTEGSFTWEGGMKDMHVGLYASVGEGGRGC